MHQRERDENMAKSREQSKEGTETNGKAQKDSHYHKARKDDVK